MSKVEVNTGGIGFCGLMTALLIFGKLSGMISLSWWWILCPVWVPIAAVILFLVAFFVCFFIAEIAKSWGKK